MCRRCRAELPFLCPVLEAGCERSGPRVALGVLLLNVPVCQVRVHLGRGDAGVAQQFLYVAERGPVLQQMGGEAVPQGMGRDVLGDAGLLAVGLKDGPDPLARQPFAPVVDEQ